MTVMPKTFVISCDKPFYEWCYFLSFSAVVTRFDHIVISHEFSLCSLCLHLCLLLVELIDLILLKHSNFFIALFRSVHKSYQK